MSDPWLTESSKKENNDLARQETVLEFEDNFTHQQHNNNQRSVQDIESSKGIGHQPLPDSDSYLQGLERKLRKLRKDSKLVDALAKKREDCLRSFLQEDETSLGVSDNAQLDFDTPIGNGDSAVQEIYRHLQPVQAVTVGETVHIVQHDQLEQQRKETEEENAEDSTEGQAE